MYGIHQEQRRGLPGCAQRLFNGVRRQHMIWVRIEQRVRADDHVRSRQLQYVTQLLDQIVPAAFRVAPKLLAHIHRAKLEARQLRLARQLERARGFALHALKCSVRINKIHAVLLPYLSQLRHR